MNTFSQQVVWITGASSGIGEALAHEFARHGARLVLSARRTAELERVAAAMPNHGTNAMILPLDLEQTSSHPAAVEHVIGNLGRIDILVNNAGISQRALVRESGLDIDRKIMEVDFFGQISLTKAVLPHMLDQGSGHFVVVSSLTGIFGYPYRSAYSAAKHALQGFFETLYLEEANHGIRVTIASPGGVNTAISEQAITPGGDAYGIKDLLQELGMSPQLCGRQIVRAVRQHKVEVVIGNRKEHLSVFLRKWMPWLLFRILKLP